METFEQKLEEIKNKLKSSGNDLLAENMPTNKIELNDFLIMVKRSNPEIHDLIKTVMESQTAIVETLAESVIPKGEEYIIKVLDSSESLFIKNDVVNSFSIPDLDKVISFNYLSSEDFSWKPQKSPSKVSDEYNEYANSGYDCYAFVFPLEEITLAPMQQALVPLAFSMNLPKQTIRLDESISVYIDAEIRPRSGLALKNKISITNSPGTIDNEFDSPVGVILQNLGSEDFIIKNKDKICQLVLTLKPILKEKDSRVVLFNAKNKTLNQKDLLALIDGKSRANDSGETGFGSSGV